MTFPCPRELSPSGTHLFHGGMSSFSQAPSQLPSVGRKHSGRAWRPQIFRQQPARPVRREWGCARMKAAAATPLTWESDPSPCQWRESYLCALHSFPAVTARVWQQPGTSHSKPRRSSSPERKALT